MQIHFSELFEQESVNELGISRKAVSNALIAPDRTETFKIESTEVRFFTRKSPVSGTDSGLLAYGTINEKTPQILNVSRAYRFYPDLCDSPYDRRPTELLEAIAERFGFEIQIAGVRKRFFAHAVLPFGPDVMSGRGGSADILKVIDPGSKPFFAELLLKVPRKEDTQFTVSLAYCLDTVRYKVWMRSHGR